VNRLTLIANRKRKNFRELQRVIEDLVRQNPDLDVQVAATEEDIEEVAKYNIADLPVVAVDNKVIIIANPKNQAFTEVLRQAVAS